MNTLNKLYPAPLWKYFEEICEIPRTSKNEQNIQEYLLNFAKKNSLEWKRDEVGNILITRQAANGCEHRKTIVLQSHMDMVGQKTDDSNHDWLTNPIIPVIEKNWVKAKDTTLGADDGMGIAAQLAVLTDKGLSAGKIEALFTVDEETGMTGATNLKPDFFTGRTMLNLDSEDEGILFVGCAGGIDTTAIMQYSSKQPAAEQRALEISITGLHGGHSGDEIHKGYGNAIIILGRFLWYMSELYNISISSYNGGSLRNAIPREAHATFTINKSSYIEVIKWFTDFKENIYAEYKGKDHDISITIRDVLLPSQIVSHEFQSKLLTSITNCPNGVLAWSKDIPGMVETSSNLAIIKTTRNNTIEICTSQRSSDEGSKKWAAFSVESCFATAGAKVTHSDGYPGWKPNTNSNILQIALKSYQKLYDYKPVVTVIHAGLECGLFFEKINDIDMISFGPTIKGAHTTEESLNIDSVAKYWDFLIEILNNIE